MKVSGGDRQSGLLCVYLVLSIVAIGLAGRRFSEFIQRVGLTLNADWFNHIPADVYPTSYNRLNL